MIRPKDQQLAASLRARLRAFENEYRTLPGLVSDRETEVFVAQLVESIRRITFIRRLRERDVSSRRADPRYLLFDPVRAAIVHQRRDNVEEAFWLVFLFVHFGRNHKGGWRYARDIYGCLGAKRWWTWSRVSTDPTRFRDWLHANQAVLRRSGVPGGFGNHRKYQSLDAYSETGTGQAVASYVEWVAPPRTHRELIAEGLHVVGEDPRAAFDVLYRSMNSVSTFGRTARFEYLAMVGKLRLAPLVPFSAYLAGSTGPLKGARLLFSSDSLSPPTPAELESYCGELESVLRVGFQAIEDALCNWQKSPDVFKAFRG